MDKKYYTPLELIKIATQHAYCAEHLLNNDAEIEADVLEPFISLMYFAFELTLKAHLVHGFKTSNLHKNLLELLEHSIELGLSNQEIQQLKQLSRAFAFRKGVDYELWDDRQHQHVFCVEIMDLYERLQQQLPIELHEDYL